jgi:hypothetical protein
MLTLLGASEPSKQAARARIEETEGAIRVNEAFLALTPEAGTNLIAKPPALSERAAEKIHQRAGICLAFYRHTLKRFSQHVHGFDLSLDLLERTHAGHPVALAELTYSIVVINTYLALALREVAVLMPTTRKIAAQAGDLMEAYARMAGDNDAWGE